MIFWAARVVEVAWGSSAAGFAEGGRWLVGQSYDVTSWGRSTARAIRDSGLPLLKGLQAKLVESTTRQAAGAMAGVGTRLTQVGVRLTQALGAATVVLGSLEQYGQDTERDDLMTLDTPIGSLQIERAVRAGTVGFLEGTGGIIGGMLGWATCGGQVTGFLCAGGAGALGSAGAREVVAPPVLVAQEEFFDWVESWSDGGGASGSFDP